MPPRGIETAGTASERPQIHALDCAATGIGKTKPMLYKNTEIIYLNIPKVSA
jgi:hypothetical protein